MNHGVESMASGVDYRELLAFVHIEKAAGTTLIHILRDNYFMRYLDVRPFKKESGGIFQIEDMRASLRINPFTECIGGHAVMPFNGLETAFPNIRYITVLRDPVARYLSQFQYWVKNLKKQISLEEFLDLEDEYNLQTKKIAGVADVERAKAILAEKFLVVGTLEKFDEFLVMLRKKLSPFPFEPYYRVHNIGKENSKRSSLLEQHKDRIIENNRLDIELYEFVQNKIMPKQREWYGAELQRELEEFKHANASHKPGMLRPYIDYAMRKLYYEPVSGGIRRIHGLPSQGSY
jgi:hypothetical protein